LNRSRLPKPCTIFKNTFYIFFCASLFAKQPRKVDLKKKKMKKHPYQIFPHPFGKRCFSVPLFPTQPQPAWLSSLLISLCHNF